MRIDEESVRDQLNAHLAGSRKGEAARIAAAAGLSTSTVSRFRSNTFMGNNEKIAERLAAVLAEQWAADGILSGRLKPWWLVNTRTGLRVVKRQETVSHILEQSPDAFVIQVWRGPEPDEIHFVKGAGRTANDRRDLPAQAL